MPILHAIILGAVQGLTEFLPISSSGHLEIVPWLFGWDHFDSESTQKAFDVALHIGTLFATIAYFRRDLFIYVREGTKVLVSRRRPVDPDGRLAWLLVLSTLPAAAVGALFESQIEDRLGTPTIIGFSLIFFGVLLAWADRKHGPRKIGQYGVRDAVTVGAAQALALNPGTSRSGITMTAARHLGFERDAAVRISFLMMVPVTLGAVVFKMVSLANESGMPDGLMEPMAVGIVTSAIFGWIAVWGTLRLVRTRSFTPFVIYRVGAGIVVLTVVASGWR